MFLKIVAQLAKLQVYLYLRLGICKYWSKFYSWLYERQFADVKISTFTELADVPIFMRNGRDWVADMPKQLWDVVGSPQYAEAVFAGTTPLPSSGFDCGRYARYAVTAIKKSLDAGIMKDKVKNPKFFTVTWLEPPEAGHWLWKQTGHNVTLLELPEGGFKYMDYFMPNPACATIEEVAAQVRARNAPAGSIPLVWGVLDVDLNVQETHFA